MGTALQGNVLEPSGRDIHHTYQLGTPNSRLLCGFPPSQLCVTPLGSEATDPEWGVHCTILLVSSQESLRLLLPLRPSSHVGCLGKELVVTALLPQIRSSPVKAELQDLDKDKERGNQKFLLEVAFLCTQYVFRDDKSTKDSNLKSS